ncbi:MAG: hypothetical protein QOK03_525 [Candidatus Binataceae bacterium]|jgi:hypothetical protein|nr:hypothetical protein [Candidatus Binataceae bacterium]
MKIVGAFAASIALCVLLLLAPTAWASGYFPPSATFVSQNQPDPPLTHFAAGRLGLILPSWNDTYLYAAYRYLAGPGFNAEEQKVLLSIWNEPQYPQPDTKAQDDWLVARAKIPGVSNLEPFDAFGGFGNTIELNEPSTPGNRYYASFINCHNDAFRAAIVTLQVMSAMLGPSSPQVKQWLDAQDLVFQNCADSSKTPQIPPPMQGGTPAEQALRAYQIASANFYSRNFDTAASMFAAIAADPNSPWRTIAPYLVARTTIRKATFSGEKNNLVLLAQAEKQLTAIAGGAGPDNLKPSARRLLGFVGCRLHPEERHAEEVRAIMRPNSEKTLAQDLRDFRECGTARQQGDYYADNLDDWIAAFKSSCDPSHAIEKWQRTGSPAWLVAAIAWTRGSNARAGELIKAAEQVGPSSPAYVTVEYYVAQRLIEQGKNDEARSRIEALLAKPEVLPPSAVNQFMALGLALARNLDEYLKYALRYPVAIDGDVYPDQFNNPYMQKFAPGPLDEFQSRAAEALLDEDSATVIDRWLPLSVLKQIARNKLLPPPLRARVAMSAWVRSIVIGDQTTARELAPIVSDLTPALKPSLDAWLAAKLGDRERFEAALIILRNPGMRPYLESGFGRLTPFDKLDPYRGNWWAATASDKSTPTAALVNPPSNLSFLSAGEKESVDREWTSLSAINGAEFLCSTALRHAALSPTDERVPEALSRCIGAVHLSPSNARCDTLAESAFDLLHKRYPKSEWARKNKFWYRGSGSP